jgi:phage recombination protein Bet
MFGEPVPGEAVKIPDFDPIAGYRPRGHYVLKTIGSGYARTDADAPRKEPEMTPVTAIAERPATLPKDQLELVRRTVATGATNDELALFLYDCERRGIHPLDKLLHFTKRGGKYTPVTSIDFMRAQAAMSGEMAGSEDPIFVETDGKLASATVTVYRITQGQRFPYAATARWAEYCPDNAPMWKRMPHTMLGKCAEALALRKAFPQQLAGLYSREEMDQADEPKGYVVTAPNAYPPSQTAGALPQIASSSNGRTPAFEAVDVGSTPTVAANDEGPDHGVDLPAGALRIIRVGPGKAGAAGEITFHRNPGEADKPNLLTWNPKIVGLATEMCQNSEPCFVGLKRSPAGNWRVEDLTRIPKNYAPPAPLAEPIDASEIPF